MSSQQEFLAEPLAGEATEPADPAQVTGTDRTVAPKRPAAQRDLIGNLPLRSKLLGIGAIGVLGALVLGGVTLVNNNRVGDANAEVDNMRQIQVAAEGVGGHIAEINGWQNSYALDAAKRGGAEAVKPDAEARKVYLEQYEAAKAAVASFPLTHMSATGAQLMQDLERDLTQWNTVDQKIVAEYAKAPRAAWPTATPW